MKLMKFTASRVSGILGRDSPPLLMASLAERLPKNAQGAFYVDSTCIDCDLCRSIAPALFNRDDETGFSFVQQQPLTDDDVAQAREALDACPQSSIGEDA